MHTCIHNIAFNVIEFIFFFPLQGDEGRADRAPAEAVHAAGPKSAD